MPVNIVNTEQFAELRQSYGYYVDKTGLLLQFLKDPTDTTRFRSPSSVSTLYPPKAFRQDIVHVHGGLVFRCHKKQLGPFCGPQGR